MTPTELTSKSPDWKSLSGKVLEGGYELKEIIEAEREKATFRVRVLGDYSLKAAASFYLLDRNEGEDQIAVWGALRTVENRSNLSIPLGTGTLDLGGTNTSYLVFQVPDETLEEVLGSRALAPEEAIEVLRSIAKGLQELHANGFVHGCISSREVLAVGNGIELSTQSIRRINTEPIVERRAAKYLAPESGPRNLTGPSDVWCLGATLFEALTQTAYEPGLLDEAANLKHPFGTMAACCLD
ncbi:MAG: protein kinase, partial [Acidobacteriota bacterium]|nr:protein kinase [Acidobacteriota bacterium]